jgi:2-keto-4-pentenoate hydratase/2-oxohepta-3-ene-1,7-dioic acid hydratase in catechol pathway
MRQARTSDLIFSVLRIVAKLAAILPLPPGDLIFTGTPSGVGGARKPPVYLRGERRATCAKPRVMQIFTCTNQIQRLVIARSLAK